MIALDAMGGDNAPHCVIEGANIVLAEGFDVRFILFGNQASIEPLLRQYPVLEAVSEIVHTESVIPPDEKPSVALRRGTGSSMRMAIDSVKEKRADCIVSAGNTGALMAISKMVFRTLAGISRPAIAGLVPTLKNDAVMLDLGANIEANANELVQFAVMGDAFARIMLSLQKPRVGLLNVGSEDMKGHDEIKDASVLLKNNTMGLDFYGFVEGNDIASGKVDVIVTDGFTGNVALKTAEGTGHLVSHYLSRAFQSSIMAKLGYVLARTAIKNLRKSLDPRRRNGAMFLGLNGIAVKSHGSADGYGYHFAIKVAIELVKNRINEKILEELKMPLINITNAAPPATPLH